MSLESRSILKRSDPFDWAFAFLLLFALATNLVWFLTDSRIVGDGSQNYLIRSIELFDRFSSIANSALPILEKMAAVVKECSGFANRHLFWPLGFHVSTYFFYSVAGTTLFAAKLNLLPYLFLLLLSTYCIGKHIDSRPVGLVAAAFLFFYPIIFQSSRQYQLDFPLTAMVALNALFLLKSEQFRNMKFSLLFGVASGWAMLIKGQYVIFMIMPLLYVLHGMSRESWCEIRCRPLHARQLRNLVLALILFVSIAMIWWGAYLRSIPYECIFNLAPSLEPTLFPGSWKFSLDGIIFQSRALFYASLRPVFSALFFIALPVFLIKKTKGKLFLLFWIIFPVFFFSFFVSLKHTRFLMPALPAMALITAVGLCHLRSRMLRAFILWGGITFAIFQFYILSYTSHDPTSYSNSVSTKGFSLLGKHGFGSGYETFVPPHNDTFKINETFDMVDDVVRFIEKASPARDPVIFFTMSGQFEGFSDFQWVFRMLLRHPSFKFVGIEDLNLDNGSVLDSIDFVVCFYFGASQISQKRFAMTGLEALLRSSGKWDGQEGLWKLMHSDWWKNYLKILAKYNDRFDRVLYETDKENSVAILIYQKKR